VFAKKFFQLLIYILSEINFKWLPLNFLLLSPDREEKSFSRRKAREEEWEYKRAQRRDSEERLQTYRDGLPDRVQGYRERLQAIKEKYQKPAPSFLDRRPLKVR
jgi:hypothetical protein